MVVGLDVLAAGGAEELDRSDVVDVVELVLTADVEEVDENRSSPMAEEVVLLSLVVVVARAGSTNQSTPVLLVAYVELRKTESDELVVDGLVDGMEL